MIFRKPYAFLIKNFRKIHIFLLFLCAYIFYKNSQTRQFVSEFLRLGTYDRYNEPISKHINFLLIISLIMAIILFVALIILLKRKNKPWKLYLIPVFEYTTMLIILIFISSFFNSYTGDQDKVILRILRDLLNITSIFQLPVLIILLIRIFGVDLNSFNFKMDQEYLELNSSDREEFEVNIDIDKHSFIRAYKRLLRNIGYIYEEHKFIINTLISIFLIYFIAVTYYTVFVLHKSYKEGQYFNVNGYTIKINHSYYTDKDYKGDVISKKSSFVILDLNIKNNFQPRDVDFGKFHVMNGIDNYGYTSKTYETDFDDLGITYDKYELGRDEEINLILIYKVNKKLNSNGFVLYYQDYIKNEPYLRKIKLNIDNVSKINETKELKIGREEKIKMGSKEKDLMIDGYDITDQTEYSYKKCTEDKDCFPSKEIINNANGKILVLTFVSDSFEGKDLIDFSSKYGKISYIDNKGKTKFIKIKNAVDQKYMGQYVYIKIPSDFESYKKKKIIYTVRNKKYLLKIK